MKGWLFGTMVHWIGFYWVVGTVQRYSNLNLPLSLLTWILFGLYSGLAFGAMSAVFLFLDARRSLPRILLLPACYTTMEFAFPFIFPWHLGAALYQVLPVIQIADVFGVYGVTALAVLVNAASWELLRSLRSGRSLPFRTLFAAAILVAFSLAYGFWRIGTVERAQAKAPDLSVGIVQANVRIEEGRSPLLASEIWRRYRRLSRDAIQQGAGLLVWPESAVRFAYRNGAGPDSASGFLNRFVRSMDRPLLFGSWALERDGPRNRAYLLGADGAVLGWYDKVHLLAFGEYMPFSDWIPQLKGLVQGVGDFRPGERVEPLCWQRTCFGVLICYEAILKGIARTFVRKGAAFLVNVTNDAWFGDTSCPEQHLMLATFRAVENRVWLVRAANTGISAFVDPTGRIVRAAGLFEQAVLVQPIDLMRMPTPYRRWGDWFPLSCSLLLVLLILRAWISERRGARGRSPGPCSGR